MTILPNFQPIINAIPAPGLVLRLSEVDSKYLRLTHVFDDCVYVMWVGEPKNVRFARRPTRKLMSEFLKLAGAPSSTWGRLSLPSGLSNSPPERSEQADSLRTAWDLIKPLVTAFSSEANLARSRFTSLIRERADATQTSFITLQRMVLRYYYFGGTRLALLSLPPGVKAGHDARNENAAEESSQRRPPKRRGRQPVLADELGANDFIVDEDDIIDMVDCLRSCLRRGPTFKTHAHEAYLAGAFRRRHPEVYAEYIGGKRVEPVTVRQYQYYIDSRAQLSDELAKNLRTQERNPGHLGSVRAAGPGETYEIDSTGGRLYLVSADDPPVLVGKPTIYLIIDRWSRFVVSAYISLQPPSYEEVRYALLIAFTSREARFRALGVAIDDERWPVGRMPAVLCPDRGSDFMSESMEQAVVQDLRIELTPLPPFCPDGKAVVERLIREIKRRMAGSGMKGVYADRPMDPQTKRVTRKAEAVAVHSLAEAYRALIKIIDDHNNRPHSALRRRRVLTQAGIRPVPKDAYLWGLKYISGLRTPPFSDTDYRRLLLSVDSASIANGVLRYKTRPYLPANETAFNIAAKSTARAKQIDIRLDKTDPHEILVPDSGREWAIFRITPGAANELAGLSLDEEEAFASQTARLWARAEHEGRITRVAAMSGKSKQPKKPKGSATKLGQQQQHDARAQETDDVKHKLTGKPLRLRHEQTTEASVRPEDWTMLDEQERIRNLALIRQHRSKR